MAFGVIPQQQHAITDALGELRDGVPGAFDRVIPLVYGDLAGIAHRQLALEASSHTRGVIARRAAAGRMLAVDEALEQLAALDARQARVVEYRFFGGMTEPETAAALGVTERTVARDRVKARAWLYRKLSDDAA
jgi:DNA-directed RNA polymerase specialized sigma24 family protein